MRACLLGVLGGICALCACSGVVSTRVLADAFNGGALDSTPDPFYGRSQRATDTVAWRMREELGEAYFEQGGKDAQVVQWLEHLAQNAPGFMHEIVARELSVPSAALDSGSVESAAANGAADGKETPSSQKKLRAALRAIHADETVSPMGFGNEPLCDSSQPNRPNDHAVERFADYVRFQVSLDLAAQHASDLVQERFATMDEAIAGGRRAFEETAAYLANRRWRRDQKHRVTGLVVKGGAATGIFSAGVVYVALNLLNECLKANLCSPDHAGFAMASGTSTGATIATAVDVFHSAIRDASARAAAMRDFRDWYMCSSMDDLYCVRNHVAFNLARSHGGDSMEVQDSFLDFTGLARKVENAYRCQEMNNGMELILNTVDFRTGRLYALSDQDPATLRAPWDVAKAVVSSAALPFIVRPTYKLPVDPVAAGNFAYLDGGIRSELPLLALVRRGVERLLVVSSGASVTGDDAPIGNALNMAIRYIDISTGGVTESELDHARTRAQASRLAEYEYCQAALEDDRAARQGPNSSKKGPPLCGGHCDADALCAGDFTHACGLGIAAPTKKRLSNEGIVAQTFQSTSVWRNEERIPGLPGYAFNPNEQRRLMLAGVEAARAQCPEIAAALDIAGVPEDLLYSWCTPRLPSDLEQCGAALLQQLKNSPGAPDCSDDRGPTPSPDAGSTNDCPKVPR